MIFGTVFTGQIKTQGKQYIETKMFCLIIPIYVVNTLLVTDIVGNGRKGIEIKTNIHSIIASIIRIIITIICVFSIGAYIGNYDEMAWLAIPTITSLFLTIYFWFYFGKTTKYERFARKQFAKEFELYILPSWLKNSTLRFYFESLKKKFTTKYGKEMNWKEKLLNASKFDEDFSLFYCLTALESELGDNTELKKILKDITLKNY